MKTNLKKTALIGVILILSIISNLNAQTVNGEIVSDTGNIQVVKVWGTHYERGYAYGYLCGTNIFSVFTNFILPNYGSLMPLAKAIIANEALFSIDPEYVTEGKGVLDGMGAIGIDTTGLSYLDLFVVNFMTDLLGFYPTKGITQNCSSLMDWGDATFGTDLNGKSVIAHHVDTSPLDTNITSNQVIVIHIPSETDEQPWILTGTAGQMVASQALNMNGVVAFLNTVNGFTAEMNKAYEPVTLAIRKGLEKIDYNNDGKQNVNDIRDALLSNTNGYAAGFIVSALAPASEGEDSLIALVAELAPQQPYITFRYNNFADNIDGDNLYAANSMIKRNSAHLYCSRYMNVSNEINNVFNGVNIGTMDNWDIMKTQSIQSTNLQFIQVVPEDCILKMAISHNGNPAYQFEPQEFNFCELFLMENEPILTDNKYTICMFPNPVSDKLFIDLNHYQENHQTIDIFDMTGQLRSSKLNTSSKCIVNTSGLESGVYIVKIYSDNFLQTFKLIKQ